MTTFCDTCEHVHPDTMKLAPWSWRCLKAPIEEVGYGFVSQDYAPHPPYARCDKLNDGACPEWEQRRMAPKEKAP